MRDIYNRNREGLGIKAGQALGSRMGHFGVRNAEGALRIL